MRSQSRQSSASRFRASSRLGCSIVATNLLSIPSLSRENVGTSVSSHSWLLATYYHYRGLGIWWRNLRISVLCKTPTSNGELVEGGEERKCGGCGRWGQKVRNASVVDAEDEETEQRRRRWGGVLIQEYWVRFKIV